MPQRRLSSPKPVLSPVEGPKRTAGLTVAFAACSGGGTPASVRPEPVEGPIPRQRRPSLPKPQRTIGVIAALTAVVMLAVLTACSDDGPSPAASATTSPPAPSPSPREGFAVVVFDTEPGNVRLNVEVADTAEERRTGLMFRESLPENAGMLFVFEQDTQQGFWMKDTTIPLSIAFIDAASGTVIDIQDMQPLDLTLHSPPSPYRYAVEANQGWFAQNGVAAGTMASIPR